MRSRSLAELAPAVLAGVCCAALAALLLLLAAQPLTTNDLWWHLERGERFATAGPWLAEDPCLHTAERPPEPHQWLFGVGLHGVERVLGLHGLRVAHGLAVCAILGLVFSLFRRAGAGLAACLATAVFIALSWYRLVQLRPDLLSIAATLLLYRLLLERPEVPGWRRVTAAAALVAVWANTHALFLVGPLLLAIAAASLTTRALLARRLRDPAATDLAASDLAWARRLGAALVLCLGAALANPRGFDQHLAFVTAARAGSIFQISDEWAHFVVFSWSNQPVAVSVVAWLLTNTVLLALLVFGSRAARSLLRARSASSLRAIDPVGLALALAGAAALGVSIRFLWMAFLPLLFLLHAGRRSADTPPRLRWALALGCLAIAVAVPLRGGVSVLAARLPRDASAYLATSFDSQGFFIEGIRFLEETEVEGKLFNSYLAGGFLCHRLAPRMRTFVDGSLNYPNQAQLDYYHVNLQRGTEPFETDLDVLDRYGVDFYFGVGVPGGGTRTDEDAVYTSANLERAPGWKLVSRSFRHAIYLRDAERNRDNLRRITRWYSAQGVPFDPELGLDVARVIRSRPRWAVEHEMLPPGAAALVSGRVPEDPARRFAAFETLGLSLALAGAYELGIDVDRQAAELRPDAPAPLRRLIYDLLRLGRTADALAVTRRLLALDPGDRRSATFARVARVMARRDSQTGLGEPGPVRHAPDAPLNALPLLVSRQPLRQ